MQNQLFPEFIINPTSLDDVAQNFRTYAEQVAFYATIPDTHWDYPYNNSCREPNPQYNELSGKARSQVIAGNSFRGMLMHLFIKDGLYNVQTPEDVITYSLFASYYVESLSQEQTP